MQTHKCYSYANGHLSQINVMTIDNDIHFLTLNANNGCVVNLGCVIKCTEIIIIKNQMKYFLICFIIIGKFNCVRVWVSFNNCMVGPR